MHRAQPINHGNPMPTSFRSTSLALVATLAVLGLTGCGTDDDDDQKPAPKTIPTVAQDAGYTTLVTAVKAADLATTLSSPGPFTVFGPSNSAFAALGPTLDTLLQPANKATLAGILKYHVLSGSVSSTAAIAAAAGAGTVATVQGQSVTLDVVGGSLYVNDAKVGPIDVLAANGVIHGLNTVLLPPTSIVQTLTDRGFTSLTGAVTAAGLVPTLSGAGPFTVFAPTNAAFDAIASTTAGLTTEELAEVLTYHVLSGTVKASGAVAAIGGAGVATVAGPSLTFSSVGGALKINGVSTITKFNIPCTNGIIHVIDTVLLPPPSGGG